jgi:IS30 family transposase
VERLSALELDRIEALLAEEAPFWRLRREVPRSRYAIYRAVKRLRRPPVPEPNRSPLRLSLTEREEISRGLAAGESLRVIAGRLGRTASTVSREVGRNGGVGPLSGVPGGSGGGSEHASPQGRQARPVSAAAGGRGSQARAAPQQIASWLVLEFPDDAEMRVSHETIYLSLFVQSRGGLRKELTRYLRLKRSVRRPGGKAPHNGQSHIPAVVNISERPAEAADRAVSGHWESQWCCQAA